MIGTYGTLYPSDNPAPVFAARRQSAGTAGIRNMSVGIFYTQLETKAGHPFPSGPRANRRGYLPPATAKPGHPQQARAQDRQRGRLRNCWCHLEIVSVSAVTMALVPVVSVSVTVICDGREDASFGAS
jgi:hypothetical protein